MVNRLSTEKLHAYFLNDLGEDFVLMSDPDKKPLLVSPKNNQSLTAAAQRGGKSLTGHRKPANHSHFFAYIGSLNTGIRTIVTRIRTDFGGIRTVTS